jgi:hypothetical protein
MEKEKQEGLGVRVTIFFKFVSCAKSKWDPERYIHKAEDKPGR